MPVAPVSACSPYSAILGPAFGSLDANVRGAHTVPLSAEGTVDVEYGSHWLVPVVVRLMGLPRAGRDQRVRLDVAVRGADVVWTRRIGVSLVRTRQRARGPRLIERKGLGRVAFSLEPVHGGLAYHQCRMTIAGIVVPPSICPRVTARVSPAERGWHVQVRVMWREHLMCGYAGLMRLG